MTAWVEYVGAEYAVFIPNIYHTQIIVAENVWNKNGIFCADVLDPRCHRFNQTLDGEDGPVFDQTRWDLVSTDNDKDGFPGVFTIDTYFTGGPTWADTVNFNLNYY